MRSWLQAMLFLLAAHGAVALPGDGAPGAKPRRGISATAATSAQFEAARLAGGETFATAVPVTSVPYSDTGSTLGHVDDYQECDFGSTGGAPDVVYAFVPPSSGPYTFDLCGSAFDTKLYLYDRSRAIVACNDDWDYTLTEGEPCFLNGRLERFAATVGDTLFVVVDGYADFGGDYTLAITTAGECDPTIPGLVLVEGEPTLAAGQTDAFNCGCDCAGAAIHQRLNGDSSGRGSIALKVGWRSVSEMDRDWIELISGSSGAIHVDFEAAVDTRIYIWNVADCVFGEMTTHTVRACQPLSLDTTVMGRANFLIAASVIGSVAPHGLMPVEYDAVLTVTGLETSVGVETTSWGHLKGLFR